MLPLCTGDIRGHARAMTAVPFSAGLPGQAPRGRADGLSRKAVYKILMAASAKTSRANSAVDSAVDSPNTTNRSDVSTCNIRQNAALEWTRPRKRLLHQRHPEPVGLLEYGHGSSRQSRT